MPRHETFDPNTEGHYDATVLTCHACASRDRKAYNRNTARDSDAPPPFGEFYAVQATFDD